MEIWYILNCIALGTITFACFYLKLEEVMWLDTKWQPDFSIISEREIEAFFKYEDFYDTIEESRVENEARELIERVLSHKNLRSFADNQSLYLQCKDLKVDIKVWFKSFSNKCDISILKHRKVYYSAESWRHGGKIVEVEDIEGDEYDEYRKMWRQCIGEELKEINSKGIGYK